MLLQIDSVQKLIDNSPFIGLLVIAIMYFFRKDKENTKRMDEMQVKNEADKKTANDKLESYILQDREQLLKVIESNTRVMENNTTVMEKLEKYLETSSH